MSPPRLGIEDEGQSIVSGMASSKSVACVSNEGLGLKEWNYIGLSGSTEDSSSISTVSIEKKSSLNFEATDLTLGLPGSQSPKMDSELNLLSSEKFDEKPLFPLFPSKDGICSSPQKAVVSGNKRGFSDTIDEFSTLSASTFNERNWMFSAAGSDSKTHSDRSSSTQLSKMPSKPSVEGPHAANGSNHTKMNGSNNSSASAAK